MVANPAYWMAPEPGELFQWTCSVLIFWALLWMIPILFEDEPEVMRLNEYEKKQLRLNIERYQKRLKVQKALHWYAFGWCMGVIGWVLSGGSVWFIAAGTIWLMIGCLPLVRQRVCFGKDDVKELVNKMCEADLWDFLGVDFPG